ncbi:hypothetical protein QBC35DRAFT_391466 [Podospora australis]|uniref:Nucleoside-diphosphate-sugar epimerase n=1 Tax=Podospora australis TaxID=1536484 RepID=A0AAN6WM99_9PEZI|nr:hypothetical protein QBC35DRAFT_391466 [Podospora australis]
MHLILTGATGLVGTAVLDAMIRTADISKISILSRSPVKLAEDAKDPRINVIINKDFAVYDPKVLDQIKGADACVWALGISQFEVSKPDLIKITKDYPLTFASAFQKARASDSSTTDKKPFNFVYVSGDGATFEPTFYSPAFAGIKGEAELALSEFRKAHPDFHANSVRPGFVDWLDHSAIKPYLHKIGAVKNFGGRLMQPVMRYGNPGRWAPTEPLGRFLTGMAMGKFDTDVDKMGEKLHTLDSGMKILENADFRKIIGLDSK